MNSPAWDQYLQRFSELGKEAFQHLKPKNTVQKFCVIVEPRQHKNLIPVIKNFMYLLQHTGWGLIVYHGPDNESFVKDGLRDAIPDNCVHYVRMMKHNLTNGEYSTMLTNPMFWECLLTVFNCEHVLIFQSDTLLLKGGDAVDNFLKYDYVGAPWPDDGICAMMSPSNRLLKLKAGNGGLSLRNVRTMLIIAHKFPYKNGHDIPEDVYFSYWLNLYGTKFRLPTVEDASAFAMEHVFNPNAAGMHSPSPALKRACNAMILRSDAFVKLSKQEDADQNRENVQ